MGPVDQSRRSVVYQGQKDNYIKFLLKTIQPATDLVTQRIALQALRDDCGIFPDLAALRVMGLAELHSCNTNSII